MKYFGKQYLNSSDFVHHDKEKSKLYFVSLDFPEYTVSQCPQYDRTHRTHLSRTLLLFYDATISVQLILLFSFLVLSTSVMNICQCCHLSAYILRKIDVGR